MKEDPKHPSRSQPDRSGPQKKVPQAANPVASVRPAPPPVPKPRLNLDDSQSNAKPTARLGKSALARRAQWVWIIVPSVIALIVWTLVIWNMPGTVTDIKIANRENSDRDAVVVPAGKELQSSLSMLQNLSVAGSDATDRNTAETPAGDPTAKPGIDPSESLASTAESPGGPKDSESLNGETTPSEEEMASAEEIPEMTDDDPSATPAGDSKDTAASSANVDELIHLSARLIKAIEGKATQKSFKEAIMPLKKASNLFPHEIRPDFYLGLVHSGIGVNDPNTARIHFRRVLDRSPKNVAAANNLALVEIKARKFSPARNYLSIATENQSRPFAVNQNLGRLLNLSSAFELKGEDLKKIAALYTQETAYRPQTGWMYMPLDDSEQSMTEYKSFCRGGKLEDTSCTTCNGAGSLPCRTCNRNGTVLLYGSFAENKQTIFGSVMTSTPTAAMSTCRVCGGRGKVDCRDCVNGNDPKLSSSR